MRCGGQCQCDYKKRSGRVASLNDGKQITVVKQRPEALQQWEHSPSDVIVVSSSVPEEEPLDEREGMGNHVCDFSVEVAAPG